MRNTKPNPTGGPSHSMHSGAVSSIKFGLSLAAFRIHRPVRFFIQCSICCALCLTLDSVISGLPFHLPVLHFLAHIATPLVCRDHVLAMSWVHQVLAPNLPLRARYSDLELLSSHHASRYPLTEPGLSRRFRPQE